MKEGYNMELIIIILLIIVFIFLSAVLYQLKKNRELYKISAKSADNIVTKSELTMVSEQLNDNMAHQIGFLSQTVNNQTLSGQQQMEALRLAVGNEMKLIRDENNKQMAEIKKTVNEKLETTLEKRLGESFNQVGIRLEQVHKGLGEMQALANNVDDLQKLLRNVKIRGIWGEVQLGAVLKQILSEQQFSENIKPNPNSNEVVEFAIKIPQKNNEYIWLPIDSKFPLEDYQRLLKAEDQGDSKEKNKALSALCSRVKAEANDIHLKYICPPYTTDFAILFLPVEGLYAEVLRQSQLCDELQNRYRVIIAGPTTFAALLNILQLGYQSVAIQNRAAEVWDLLGIVKAEFQMFGESLAKSRKKVQELGNSLEMTERRTRVMQRKLKEIETINEPTDGLSFENNSFSEQ